MTLQIDLGIPRNQRNTQRLENSLESSNITKQLKEIVALTANLNLVRMQKNVKSCYLKIWWIIIMTCYHFIIIKGKAQKVISWKLTKLNHVNLVIQICSLNIALIIIWLQVNIETLLDKNSFLYYLWTIIVVLIESLIIE